MTRVRHNTERVLSNAEKCKRYREKNKEKYRREDATNKKYNRMVMARENPAANQRRLKEQAKKKQLYRQKKKMEKELEATSLLDETPVPSTSTPVPSSSFSHKSSARCLKRAAEALPRSPRKKREVVETLASNVLQIKVLSVFEKKRQANKRD